MSRKKKHGTSRSYKRRFVAQATRKGRRGRRMPESELRALTTMFREIGHANRAILDERESGRRGDADEWFDDGAEPHPQERG